MAKFRQQNQRLGEPDEHPLALFLEVLEMQPLSTATQLGDLL